MTNPPPSTEPPTPSAVETPPKTTAFRFKEKRPRSSSPHSLSHDNSRGRKRRHHHRHHHHHPPQPSAPTSPTSLDPSTAFRESLFDALADDEGAAFWESVYGQPMHTYAPPPGRGPTGALEQMSEEEYVSYVRGKMWEKSHGYIVEERAQREGERRERERVRREQLKWSERVEEGLRKGPERKRARRWTGVWEGYLRGWEDLRNEAEGGDEKKKPKALRDRIEWPVESGLYKDVGKEAVETFLRNAPQPGRAGERVDLLAVLKAERVRWHPDKIQQRFGGLGLDEGTMKAVTAVFQVIDQMWSDAREKQRD